MTADELKTHFSNRYKSLQDLRRPMEPLWSLVDEVILPYNFKSPEASSNVINSSDQSISVNKKIYDGTGMMASTTFANTFAGTVIPRNLPWVNILPEDLDMQRDRGLSKYAKYSENHVYSRLNKSNFFESRTAFIKAGADYGTSASYKHEDPKTGNLVFETVPNKTYYIDDNEFGECDTLWRELWMYNKHILSNFNTGVLDPNDIKKLKDNLNGKTLIIHAVEPRSDFDPTSKLAKKRKYGSYYLFSKDFKILEESGFDNFPYKVWRPFRQPGLVYGVGPGIFCIRDTQVLNQAARTLIDYANKSVDPPFAIPKDLEGEEELFPGGRNYINPEDIQGFRAITTGLSYPIGKDQVSELRKAVERHYMVDYFMMLNQMEARDRTALEVSELQAEKSSMVSAILSSFTSGYLDLEIEEIVSDDLMSGKMNKFKSIGGKPISYKFDYIGPLPMNQRTYHRTSGIRRVASELIPLAKFVPTILDYFDEGEYAQAIGEGFNSLSVIRTSDDVAKRQAARAQMQAQQMQAQQMQQAMQTAAEVASKGGKAPEDGSLAQKMGA